MCGQYTKNVPHFYSLRWVAILQNSNSVGLENKK